MPVGDAISKGSSKGGSEWRCRGEQATSKAHFLPEVEEGQKVDDARASRNRTSTPQHDS